MKPRQTTPNTVNLSFIEGMYRDYRRNPRAVPDEWRAYFAEAENGSDASAAEPTFRPSSLFHSQASRQPAQTALQDRALQLIRAYRLSGHLAAKIDPLGRIRPTPPELEPEFHRIHEADLRQHISCSALLCGTPATLREILERLRNTYCRSIGVEYMHIDDVQIRRWLQARMEVTENRATLTSDEQWRILTRLTHATAFEEFIRRKFVGAKSFSLEGSETLIPLLDLAIDKAGEQSVNEIVVGMAHRGRLNVLANVLQKPERQIFREFLDADFQRFTGRGDVKYHLGFSSDWQTSIGAHVHVSLCFNPSHLEFVNAVALGRTRAKLDRIQDMAGAQKLAVLIHGDAAVAGQGVVQEVLNLSQLPGYSVGGALHVVVNNQIGFTTGPEQYRSTRYATDIFKMLQVPIFHVNGEDPEAVAQCVRLALDFRAEYQRDVVIDMYGYRRLGHNESDEPAFTQPLLYDAIRKRKSVRDSYLDHLFSEAGNSRTQADQMVKAHRDHLETELAEARQSDSAISPDPPRGNWTGYVGGLDESVPDIIPAVSSGQLAELLERQTQLPENFRPHSKIQKFLEHRRGIAVGRVPVDWSAAEALAIATLAVANHPVRLTGQDSERGTFSHRHAVLHDSRTAQRHIPLQHLTPDQAKVDIVNSPLSEAGVLGFDYGYSLDRPEGLVVWEAQFGDFWNTAQVIVDQFIASAETKWNRLSGIVLLLPHGMEGQGPEHSSARMERFLNLAAEDNLQVVYPTTAAQFYHLLRRQVLRPWRKPLIVLTPKSLLRHPRVSSTLADLAEGGFQRLIPDARSNRARVRRVLLCTGKLFYELDDYRERHSMDDVAIVRLEQLYPLHAAQLEAAMQPYRDGTPVFWVQEEPENMGAWRHLSSGFGSPLLGRFPWRCIARPASATPATGSHASHEREQRALIERALTGK